MNPEGAAYGVDCNLIGKVKLEMTLIVTPIMKVSLYFIIHPWFGLLTLAAVLSPGLYIPCLRLLLFSFVGKVNLKKISCFLLISHEQDLSLLGSATGIRN